MRNSDQKWIVSKILSLTCAPKCFVYCNYTQNERKLHKRINSKWKFKNSFSLTKTWKPGWKQFSIFERFFRTIVFNYCSGSRFLIFFLISILLHIYRDTLKRELSLTYWYKRRMCMLYEDFFPIFSHKTREARTQFDQGTYDSNNWNGS